MSDEPATIVVASAGSGKTAVVAARVAYLVRSKLAEPQDILLLAFNRVAAQSMRARCAALVGAEVQATTFHALGRAILSAVNPKTLPVSPLATDERRLDTLISNAVTELYKVHEFAAAMSRFIRLNRRPNRGGGPSQTLSDYERDLERGELRTLTGELVKSRGELDIANHLYVSGIRFEYEKPFDHVVSGAPKDYRPDFYLPAAGVFIEFFGIDRAGKTAPGIDRKKYAEEMAWKRNIHAKFGTRLIQLYQYQRNDGSLISELDRALQGHSVQGEPLDATTVLRLVGAPNAAGGSFADLVKASLVHFKSNDLSFTELSRRIARFKGLEAERARAFVTVFEGIFDHYQQELAVEGAIDFSDMITEAAAAIRRGAFSPKWRHIIVDEFQDISVGRYRLLDQLLRGPAHPKLFAVGDDWQSINRFAGSELTIMTEADRYFRSPTVMFLRDTFRFGQALADVSSAFVTRNPGQLRKRVHGIEDAGKPAVSLWWTNCEGSKALTRLVGRMAKRVPPRSSLLVLARYNKLLPQNWVQRELTKQWAGGTLAFSTVHAAKGLEADYVILLGVRDEMPRAENGYLSIPSAQADDPLLELVMPERESFEHAEERRLFYVALTRAKRHVALICNPTFPSVFATELVANDKVAARGQPYVDIPCPKCQAARRRGALRWQDGAYRRCNHAKCSFMIRRCTCGSGYMVPGEREVGLRCTDAMCDVGETH